MSLRSNLFFLLAIGAASTAVAGPSQQHSVQAAGHSSAASTEGSAALATGAGTVIAVPIIALGSAVTISGAALAQVGTGTVKTGSTLLPAQSSKQTQQRVVTPNGPPDLR